MQGIGDRLRQRARGLGLTDTEVARRLGMSQARYANYVADKREPDYRTLLDICRILTTSPDHLLGFSSPTESGMAEPAARFAGPPASLLRQRIRAASEALEEPNLRIAAALIDTLVSLQAGQPGDADGPEKIGP
jgi:transcriptional regulator with XRE-family HTH domain